MTSSDAVELISIAQSTGTALGIPGAISLCHGLNDLMRSLLSADYRAIGRLTAFLSNVEPRKIR